MNKQQYKFDANRPAFEASVSNLPNRPFSLTRDADGEYSDPLAGALWFGWYLHAAHQACALTTEPIALVVNKYGDPEAFAERELRIDPTKLQELPIGTTLFPHQQNQVEVFEAVDMLGVLLQTCSELRHSFNRDGSLKAVHAVFKASVTTSLGFQKSVCSTIRSLKAAVAGATSTLEVKTK